MLHLLVIAVVVVVGRVQARLSYDGYRMMSVSCDNLINRQIIRKIADYNDRSLIFAEDEQDCREGRRADIIVSPMTYEIISNLAEINSTMIIDDLGAHFAANARAEADHPYINYQVSANEFFESYRELDEIEDYFDGLCNEFSSVCSRFSIGRSYEGRDLFGYRVTSSSSNASKVHIVYTGWIHPREWIAGTSLQYTMDWLIRGGSGSNLLETSVMDFVPVLNPDGYVYTRTEDNLWRKSRKPNAGACIGTDLNRNWQFEWATVGSSSNPCSDTYHGSRYFDNPETAAISDYLIRNPSVVSFIDWHAYSRYVMYVWGCYIEFPPAEDYAVFQEVGQEMVQAIATVRGTRYIHGSISDIIYEAAGSSSDYVYGQLGRLFALAYEIGNAFQPPVSEIVPTGEEMIKSTIAHVNYVARFYNGNVTIH